MNESIPSLLGLAYGVSEVALSVLKRSQRSEDAADGGSLRVLWITIICSMVLGILAANIVPQAQLPHAASVQSAGFVVFLAGLVLRWTSILWLGKSFTVNVAVSADQRVIDTGPYRYIRHPSYTGALVVFLGFALATANWLTLLVIMLPITWAFMRRIRIEEAALSHGLGESYRAYMRRTKRLVPFVY